MVNLQLYSTDPVLNMAMGVFFVLFAFLFFLLAVWIRSLFIRKATGKPPVLPGLSILIPAHNEQHIIASCLDAIAAADYPSDRMEILVIDDGSSDSTREIVRHFISKHPALDAHLLRSTRGKSGR
ncbi:MAG: glycosyltransferase [DPANN group archaeon]|nr:glycosyltransferase [DPANN group archaeon]